MSRDDWRKSRPPGDRLVGERVSQAIIRGHAKRQQTARNPDHRRHPFTILGTIQTGFWLSFGDNVKDRESAHLRSLEAGRGDSESGRFLVGCCDLSACRDNVCSISSLCNRSRPMTFSRCPLVIGPALRRPHLGGWAGKRQHGHIGAWSCHDFGIVAKGDCRTPSLL